MFLLNGRTLSAWSPQLQEDGRWGTSRGIPGPSEAGAGGRCVVRSGQHLDRPPGNQSLMVSLLATDPSRYRCSPERLKKAWSSQDEVSTHARQGRRQSGKRTALWERTFFRGSWPRLGIICRHLVGCYSLQKTGERGRVGGGHLWTISSLCP